MPRTRNFEISSAGNVRGADLPGPLQMAAVAIAPLSQMRLLAPVKGRASPLTSKFDFVVGFLLYYIYPTVCLCFASTLHLSHMLVMIIYEGHETKKGVLFHFIR